MKRALITLATVTTLATLALLAACSADDSSTTATSLSVTTAATPTPSPSPVVEQDTGTPVDGTWQAGPFPLSRVRDALQESGFATYFARMDIVPGKDLAADVVYDLKIQGGGLLMAITYDGKPLGVVDRQGVQVVGHQVRFVLADCASTYRWTANDERLTLELVKDTCPDYKGTPDAAYMTALYAAVPFARA